MGSAVSVSGGKVAVGSLRGSEDGAVYLYTLDQTRLPRRSRKSIKMRITTAKTTTASTKPTTTTPATTTRRATTLTITTVLETTTGALARSASKSTAVSGIPPGESEELNDERRVPKDRSTKLLSLSKTAKSMPKRISTAMPHHHFRSNYGEAVVKNNCIILLLSNFIVLVVLAI